MSLSAGSRLGPYKILAPLGADSPDRRRRFESEAKAASTLHHPNILTFHDIGEDLLELSSDGRITPLLATDWPP